MKEPSCISSLDKNPVSEQLCESVGFELLGSSLGKELKSSLQTALDAGVIFQGGLDPLSIFRHTLRSSIRDIESHPRGKLLQEFLRKGPYEDAGRIPDELRKQRLSDDETASAITFIYSHMVNSFKGALAELLAADPCMSLCKKLRQVGELPEAYRLYHGDMVAVRRKKGTGMLKGADLHVLSEVDRSNAVAGLTLLGVAEVKSYRLSLSRMRKQIAKHIQRTEDGLWVAGVNYPAGKIIAGYENEMVLRISVMPAGWKLSRSFHFEEAKHGSMLRIDRRALPSECDEIKRTGNSEWSITLRWSQEALAEAAYEMTFWYMKKVGEVIYSKTVPKEWDDMTPAKAGRNAVKMMLYYAIMRCRTLLEERRAIALYNSYGYGYALGMNFRNAEGRREMLWPQDLDEILINGKTDKGCCIQ